MLVPASMPAAARSASGARRRWLRTTTSCTAKYGWLRTASWSSGQSATPAPNGFQPATDGVRCLGAEREAHRRHHEARRQRRTPVAEGERRARQHDQLSPTVEPFDRDRGARDVAAVGAGVHEQCAADGARNALRVLEAREPPAGGG